jgi:hypothetical protein
VINITIPSKDEIKDLSNKIRENIDFDGEIDIKVEPYLMNDLVYSLHTDLSKLEILIYSARYPSSFWMWSEVFYEEINAYIRKLRKES